MNKNSCWLKKKERNKERKKERKGERKKQDVTNNYKEMFYEKVEEMYAR